MYNLLCGFCMNEGLATYVCSYIVYIDLVLAMPPDSSSAYTCIVSSDCNVKCPLHVYVTIPSYLWRFGVFWVGWYLCGRTVSLYCLHSLRSRYMTLLDPAGDCATQIRWSPYLVSCCRQRALARGSCCYMYCRYLITWHSHDMHVAVEHIISSMEHNQYMLDE